MRTDTPSGAPTRVAVKTDVSPGFAAQIRHAAEQDGRTVSNYLRRLLTQDLESKAAQRQEAA